MKVISNKASRFGIFPSKEQNVLLDEHFNCSRFVYNYLLDERKEQSQKDKKFDAYYAQAKKLTRLKKPEDIFG